MRLLISNLNESKLPLSAYEKQQRHQHFTALLYLILCVSHLQVGSCLLRMCRDREKEEKKWKPQENDFFLLQIDDVNRVSIYTLKHIFHVMRQFVERLRCAESELSWLVRQKQRQNHDFAGWSDKKKKNTENPEGKRERRKEGGWRRHKKWIWWGIDNTWILINIDSLWFWLLSRPSEEFGWLPQDNTQTAAAGAQPAANETSVFGGRERERLDNTVWQVEGNLRRRKIEKGSDFVLPKRREKRHKFSRKKHSSTSGDIFIDDFSFLVLLNFLFWRFSP